MYQNKYTIITMKRYYNIFLFLQFTHPTQAISIEQILLALHITNSLTVPLTLSLTTLLTNSLSLSLSLSL